ncbi:hypothetical protein [Mannheimia haemolytica]|uniref:hypothetical protein n=1 Tax=Mannheimia haemolytica TaxID=75985 RepID=UPI0039FD146F
MQNNKIHTFERISQTAIKSGNISPLDTPEARINMMLSDYSFRISSLESDVKAIEDDVKVIKSNYLTRGDFYKTGAVALFTLMVAAVSSGWMAFENLDFKITAASDKSDRKFELVELVKISSHTTRAYHSNTSSTATTAKPISRTSRGNYSASGNTPPC